MACLHCRQIETDVSDTDGQTGRWTDTHADTDTEAEAHCCRGGEGVVVAMAVVVGVSAVVVLVGTEGEKGGRGTG